MPATITRLSPRLAIPTVLLYAAGYPLGTATVAVMSPFLVIFLRFAGSALVLWAIVAARRTALPPRRQIVHAMIAGLLTQAVQFLGLYWGLAHGVSAGLASLVIALNPVITAAVMIVVTGHRESRSGVVALILAAAAVLLACAPRIAADHQMGIGIVAVVIAMLGLSAGGVYQGRFCADIDPWLVTALGVTAATPVAGLAAILTGPQSTNWPRALLLLAVMIIATSVGATTLYSACIKKSGARAASVLFAVIPAAASVMAWAALGETLSPLAVAGLTLGAAACMMQARAGAPSPKYQEQQRVTVRTTPTAHR
ncbi:DMT family transporter [Nocardia sp. NPDC019395]|uniref:DMT family transporter n=1 Tax=Nocardia sp. NPDC019395 TaxID=3154686 RepID=UPI0033EE387A